MTKKICFVIFSTNRIEYLCKTLESTKKILWDGTEVHKIFYDDMPFNRHNMLIQKLCESFGFTEGYLHPQNLGLSVTWTNFWNLIRSRDYDYVFHMEDDVVILNPFRMVDLIDILEHDTSLTQICLKRQKWYSNEEETRALETDKIWQNGYRYESNHVIFSPMASLYHMDIVRQSYSSWYKNNYPDTGLENINLNEGMIGKVWAEGYGKFGGRLKTVHGDPMVHHIGEYFTGKRVLPNEPNYEQFSKYDPMKKYYSRDGRPFP